MLGLWDLDLQVSAGMEWKPLRETMRVMNKGTGGVETFKLVCYEPQMMNMEL